jgi:sterol desaturase/sphingolipid hydroxylase (fatty acid hydroxylase superfamily)
MKGMTVMYEYRAKKWGVALSAIGLLLLIAERIHPFVLMAKYSATQHRAIFQWVAFLGLVVIMYSKEKYDDERAKAVRLKAMQIAFMMQISLIMSMALVSNMVVEVGNVGIGSGILFAFAGLGIFTYLLVFYTGIYFDTFWDYEDRTLWQNLSGISRNKWGMLIYLAIGAIVITLLTLLDIPEN